MKKWIFACLIFFAILQSHSQKITNELHLKDGDMVNGSIIENENESLKFESYNGSTWAFTPNKLEKTKIGVQNTKSSSAQFLYAFSLSAGSLIGSSKNEKQTPLSVIMEHQLRVNKHISIGGVVGLEFLNEAVMPLGLSLKGYFSLNPGNELYLGLSGGYLYSLEVPYNPYNYINDNLGGTYANIEIGTLFSSNSRTRFFIAAGYRYAELHYTMTDYYWLPDKRDMYFDRFNLRFGLWIQ